MMTTDYSRGRHREPPPRRSPGCSGGSAALSEREVNKLKGATPAPCPEHHLHQLAAAGDEVDGELLLPAHHARSLCASSIATAASASAAQPGAAAPAPLALLP